MRKVCGSEAGQPLQAQQRVWRQHQRPDLLQVAVRQPEGVEHRLHIQVGKAVVCSLLRGGVFAGCCAMRDRCQKAARASTSLKRDAVMRASRELRSVVAGCGIVRLPAPTSAMRISRRPQPPRPATAGRRSVRLPCTSVRRQPSVLPCAARVQDRWPAEIEVSRRRLLGSWDRGSPSSPARPAGQDRSEERPDRRLPPSLQRPRPQQRGSAVPRVRATAPPPPAAGRRRRCAAARA